MGVKAVTRVNSEVAAAVAVVPESFGESPAVLEVLVEEAIILMV
jgi:hypothetical protein